LLTVTDRGFQVGDGIFETIRVVGGRVLELSLHASRLQGSAAVTAMPLPDDLERWLGQAIADLCRANRLDGSDTQVAVRVIVSRGPSTGAHSYSLMTSGLTWSSRSGESTRSRQNCSVKVFT
jgi:branched-subunit amino acid aminotransferase/4-amino-4-deoxychorismate lyase